MNGWGRERLKEDEREFQESVAKSPTPAQISEAEEAWGWLALVSNEDHRAALAAWAGCMADNKRRFFKDWCKKHGISEKTGRKRKDLAIARIFAQLIRSDVQNCDNGRFRGLLEDPETGDVDGTLDGLTRDGEIIAWAASGSPPVFEFARLPRTAEIETVESFDWAAKRNERRRQRSAARKAA